MTERGPVVLILGSGPNVVQAAGWHRSLFDHIVVINNAWQVRPDRDALVFPEDFPAHRMPPRVGPDQTLVDADAFVPAQNRYGGFVFAGATLAFTTAYWALAVSGFEQELRGLLKDLAAGESGIISREGR